MAIVAKRRNYQAVKQSQPALERLLVPTDIHPRGRVQIDPKTGMPYMPRRNILYMNRIRRRGQEINVEVNGGHAKADGSVWRIALAGPTRFIWKMLRDELAYRLRGFRVFSAPSLTDEEMVEARQFVAYLIANNKDALPPDFLNTKYDHGMREIFSGIDKQFYAWLKKQEKLTELPKLNEAFFVLPA